MTRPNTPQTHTILAVFILCTSTSCIGACLAKDVTANAKQPFARTLKRNRLAQGRAGAPRTESLLRSGRNMLDRGQVEAALDLFRKYTDSKPIDPEGYFWEGVALDEAGNLEEAAQAYETAIEKADSLDLNSAEIWTNLGNVLLKTNKLDSAEEKFKKAIEIDPHLVPARLNLARVLIEKNECQGALESLNRCADLHFNGPQLAYYRAKALLKLGRPEEAAVQVDKLLLQLPVDSELRLRAQQEFAAIKGR
ncbi:MAG: tetratricopeptide repeat protein [Candidatus Obscuribacterales bacterium]|nr:tetratricopeptide repeat protein [Candidatus Obscuribacterales bacterium]